MTDNNNRSTLKEAFDAELMKRLEENPPEIPTYEEFSAMVDKSLAERCRRRKRIAGIAAGFVVVLLAGILACTNLTADVDADKNPKEERITEDGVIIEDGGWGSSEDEDNVRIVTDWEQVEEAKVILPNLIVPKYVPKEYEFEKLTIEKLASSSATCEYVFSNEDKKTVEIEIYFIKGGEESFAVNSIDRILETSKGSVYIQEMKTKIATIQIDDGKNVVIWHELPDQELIKVIEGLSN